MNVSPAAEYEAVLAAGATGLVDTIALGVHDNETGFVDELSTDDVSEIPAGSGIYVATRVAPDLAGQYTLIWSLDGSTDPDQVRIEELVVTSSRAAAGSPGGRDLCTLADVLRYVPGYQSDPGIDETLQVLVTAESRELLKLREFTPIPDLDARLFDLADVAHRTRTVAIGDCAAIDALEMQDDRGTTVAEIDPATVIRLPLVREEWEPIQELRFRRDVQLRGCYLQVTGTWGFPLLPEDVTQACAKRVILRYLNDVAAEGTSFADALNDTTINIGALFRSAQETMDFYRRVGVA